MDKLIITVAVTGSWPTREMNPNIPYTPREIAESAIESWKGGAAIAHIHVRDPQTGKPSKDINHFREVVDRIRSKSDMIINLTTSSRGIAGVSEEQVMKKRVEPLELRPEICSLDVGTMNFGPEVFLNPPKWGEFGAKKMVEKGIKPEIEVFDAGHVETAKRLIDKGLIGDPPWFQLCLGVVGGIAATPKNLVYLREILPTNALWSVLGIGKYEFSMISISMIMGGHIRVGFEDNIYLSRGVLAKSNAELVDKAVKLANMFDRDIADCEETRKILHI
jgi:3-keto-5-aminohexanoate cleavage enzyme